MESSSSEKIQFEKNQRENGREPLPTKNWLDDLSHRRKELDDPEQEFLLRLQERHGESVDPHVILHCITADLKSYSDLKAFLDFEQKQTTAPHKLKNPAGHYRCTVGKFYEARAKRRDWDIRSQMKALEAKISGSTGALKDSRTCSLGHCNGTGECWDEGGLVAPCNCEIGRQLPAKVLAAFEQMNTLPRGTNGVFQ